MKSKPDSLPAQQQNQQPGLEEMRPQPAYIRATYRGSNKLQDKVALITGGDSGISRAVAGHSAREGATVAITYLLEQQAAANETERLVLAKGSRCLQLPGNLRHASFSAEQLAKFGQDTTMKRPGQPSEVVPAYVFWRRKTCLISRVRPHVPNGGKVLNT